MTRTWHATWEAKPGGTWRSGGPHAKWFIKWCEWGDRVVSFDGNEVLRRAKAGYWTPASDTRIVRCRECHRDVGFARNTLSRNRPLLVLCDECRTAQQ
jgi:hypothetical protein